MPELADPHWKAEGPPEETHCPECDLEVCEDFIIGAGYPREYLDIIGRPAWGCYEDDHALCRACHELNDPRIP